ncbi:MAG: hypothetical protein H6832_11740 [Planctomycetes bacterium]|nr:hypothetical protein [Planctomycetota bacterium]
MVQPNPKPRGEPSVLTLRQAVHAIFRGRWLLFVTTMLGLLGGSWVALSKPNSYVSVGKFLFRPGGEQIVIDPFASQGDGTPQRQPLTANAEAILKSEEVLRRTIRRIGPGQILAPYKPEIEPDAGSGISALVRQTIYALQRQIHGDGPKKASESDALLSLQQRLTVTSPKTNQVLSVAVEANEPRLAKRILEAYMDEAQARHLEVYSAQRSIREIEETKTEIGEKLSKARSRLDAFLKQIEVDDFEADLAQALDNSRQTRLKLDAARTNLQTSKTTLAGLRDRLEGLSPTVTVTSDVPIANPRIPLLEAQIAKVGADLLGMRAAGLRPEDKQITRAQATIDDLRRELETEYAKKAGTRRETREEPSQEFLATKQNISQIQLSLVVEEEQIPGLEQMLELQKQRASKLLAQQPQWRTLQRDLDRLTAHQDQLEQMLTLARKKNELDEKRISSLAILDRPNLPLTKEGPQRARIVLGGLIGGLFLGIALLLIRALTDNTVRTVEDLEDLTAIKVLATIPNLDKTTLRRHESMRITSWQ